MVIKNPDNGVISEDALRFAKEQGIVEYVEKAMQAARDIFTDADCVSAKLKRDPEFDDFYVDIVVIVPYDLDAEAQHHEACMMQWITLMPSDVLGKISLSSSWAK